MHVILSILVAVVLAGSVTIASAAPPAELSRSPSSQTWPTATPEEVGIDSGSLVEMFDFVRERQIPVHSIQLVRGGRL